MFGINACALCTDRPRVVTVVVDEDETSSRPSDTLRYRKGGEVRSLAHSEACDGCQQDLAKHGDAGRFDRILADGTNAPTYKVRIPWKDVIQALRD